MLAILLSHIAVSLWKQCTSLVFFKILLQNFKVLIFMKSGFCLVIVLWSWTNSWKPESLLSMTTNNNNHYYNIIVMNFLVYFLGSSSVNRSTVYLLFQYHTLIANAVFMYEVHFLCTSYWSWFCLEFSIFFHMVDRLLWLTRQFLTSHISRLTVRQYCDVHVPLYCSPQWVMESCCPVHECKFAQDIKHMYLLMQQVSMPTDWPQPGSCKNTTLRN